jgi:fluoride exporter
MAAMDEDGLPLDPDIEVDESATGAPRAVHLRLDVVAMVFVGGALGTLCRYLVTLVIPEWNGVPIATLVINVVGAFILGLLLVSLTHHGPDHGGRRAARLFIGTGILGGFTTYSAFAVDADGLIAATQVVPGVLYALATIILGAAASFGGIALGFFHPLIPRRPLGRRGSDR